MPNVERSSALKTLRWSEPLAVRWRYYPASRLDRLSWPICASLIFFGMLAVVVFVHNPDPGAKWVVLAFACAELTFIGFVAPYMWGRSSRCKIGKHAFERSGGLPTFVLAAIIFHSYTWHWRDITRLDLRKEELGGVEYLVLWVHGRHDRTLGCMGLASEAQIADVQAWAEAKNCPLVIAESPANHSPTASDGPTPSHRP